MQDVESKYYANGEDAYEMRKYFVPGGGPKRRVAKGIADATPTVTAAEAQQPQQAVVES